MTTVAFAGIGKMGWPMAARVVSAGHDVAVFDAVPGLARRFVLEVGGRAVDTAAELSADILVTMLPSSNIVEDLLVSQAVLDALPAGALILEMSSGHPVKTKALAEVAKARGVTLVDAPVSGGVPRARTGDLAIMVGGAAADIDRARPVLELMGSSIYPTGDVGSAHAMKAINNLCNAAGFLIGVEAMVLGKKFGLNPETVVDVLNASTGMTNATQKKFKQFVLSRSFDSGFGLDLLVKDIGIAIAIAAETSADVPFSAECARLWSEAQQALGQGLDHTELARFLEDRNRTALA